MPTPPSVPNVCRWRILGTLANLAPWGVRFYTQYTGGTPSSDNMLTLAEQIAATWNDTCGALQAADVITTQCDGVDLSSTSGASATADVDDAGGGPNPAVANQIAAIGKFIIARRYRGGKPKMFLPGVATAFQADDSHWTTTFANDYGSALNSFNEGIADLSAGSTNLVGIVNVSFYQGFSSSENPVTKRYRNIPTYRTVPLVDSVTSFTADTLMGSQRRRRVG